MKTVIYLLIIALALPFVFRFFNRYLKRRAVKKNELKEHIYEVLTENERQDFLITITKIKTKK